MKIDNDLNKKMNKAMGLISFPMQKSTTRQLANVCFYNNPIDSQDIWDFHYIVDVLSEEEAQAYSFIMNHQHLYVSDTKMSEKKALILVSSSIADIKKEQLSTENQYMLLNIAMLHKKIEIVLDLIEQNILPSPYHKNLFVQLLKSDEAIKVINLLEEKDFLFEEDFDDFYLKEALKEKNMLIINKILTQKKVEEDNYFINKNFAYYLMNNKINKKMFPLKEKLIDEEINKHLEIFNEFFSVMDKESLESLTHHLRNTEREQTIQDKILKHYQYHDLNKKLSINQNSNSKMKL